MRTLRRILLAAGLVAVLVAADARAATYDVRVCADDPALSSSAVEPVNTRPDTLVTSRTCLASPVGEFDGLLAADLRGGPLTLRGAIASWTLRAASGTRIASAQLRRYLGKRSNSWDVWTRAGDGRLLESCQISGSLSCTVGSPPTDPQSRTTYTGIDTDAISWGVSCVVSLGDCSNGGSLHDAWAVVYGATVTVEDPTTPALRPLAGTLLSPVPWHSGTEDVSIAASDVSGISRLELLVDGASHARTNQRCDYSRMRPCPASGQFSAAVELGRLGEGVHQVAGRAVDAAGQSSTSAPVAVGVDTQAPVAPQALVAARAADGSISVRWANPDQGTASPIVAASYEFCPVASDSACTGGGVVAGNGIASIDGIAAPAGAASWDLVVWLTDGAGHADRAGAARQTIPAATPPAPPPRPPTRPTTRRATGLRIRRVVVRDGRLRVRGTVRRGVRGRVVVTLRANRRARARVKRWARIRRAQFVATVPRCRSVVRRGRCYLTVRFPGSRSFRATSVVRRIGRK